MREWFSYYASIKNYSKINRSYEPVGDYNEKNKMQNCM